MDADVPKMKCANFTAIAQDRDSWKCEEENSKEEDSAMLKGKKYEHSLLGRAKPQFILPRR